MTASDLKALARALLGQLVGQLQARLLPRLRPHLRPRTLLLLPALFVLYVLVLIPFTPGIRDLRRAKVDQPAQVYSADGKLLAEFKPTHREWVSLKSVSPQVVDALIATEDRRFYTHHGIDFKRTASAALHTLKGDRQGGSTLTQQLARNLFPEEIGRSQTLTRKLKEAITAFKIEAVYSKDEILETYLNTVPFLYNAYGIEMAARTYFGKSAGELDALQSATLIGMLKGNSYYNPVINPERALDRRNIVLGQMVKFGHLPAAKLDALVKRPLRIDFERQTEEPGRAPHFAQQLRKWLIAWADDNDYNIYSDGLVVRTTIDSRLQTMATNALVLQGNQLQSIANAAWGTRGGCAKANADLAHAFIRETGEYRAARDGGMNDADALAKLGADRGFMQSLCESKTRVQAGFVALDPRNGQIKAWVGSRDFAQDPFDHVAQARRQPGSTFKPFVYGAAFEHGAKPTDTIVDQAVEIPVNSNETWRPTDDAPPSGKPVSLRDGIAYSKNRITAQLMESVGPGRVAGLARDMGVRESHLDVVPSLALGTSPVTLKEMVSAYGTIANDGSYIEPLLVTRIENKDGEVLAQFENAPERALSVDATRKLVDVMRDVINRGTGTTIRTRFGIRGDVAGKTGTTQDNADGWFILMQPQLVAGAWVGFNDSRVTLRSDYWGQGAHSALPIVGDFMQRALRSRLIDARARFDTQETPGLWESTVTRLRAWMAQTFTKEPKPSATKQTAPQKSVRVKRAPAEPEAEVTEAPPPPQPQPPVFTTMPPILPEPAAASAPQ
ncbi:transglycosylase domain-containing protein [Caballeronia sp. LZ043]|uniref:penicillin-binding protein 1A n=1 Tax=Caballeronia sp. LZ043 TaxID=3038569 RepID=UPI002855BCAB|nr:transglycosylase domain-containing protein [Caballeronia sp. LZ043]MDR5822771.1 transglycosylase domain-containing protein [Caballeronia sp. LZ043]